MKNMFSKTLFTLSLIVAFGFSAFAQSFEGTIEFKKAGTADTTKYVYTVKGNKVKIDEIGSKSKKPEGTFMVDLDAKTMLSLNHERKLYMDQKSPSTPVIKGKCDVQKGKNTKTLQGFKCTEYIVTNNEENTKIVYYIAAGNYTFFEKLLRQLNRKDKSSTYFLQIPGLNNGFPMLSIQSDLTGVETGRLEVLKVNAKTVDASTFQIPAEYKKFEK
jgi:Domain of unknown function (DUF4412)